MSVAEDLKAAVADVADLDAERRKVEIGEGEASRRVDPLEHVRAKLRLPELTRVIQRGDVDALIDFELADGTLLAIGTMADLENPAKVRTAINERPPPQESPPRYTREKWDPILDCLRAIREIRAGETPEQTTRSWLAEYVGGHAGVFDLADPEERREALGAREVTGDVLPFWADDQLHIYLPDFERHLRMKRRANVSLRDLSARLDRLGFRTYELMQPSHPEPGEKALRRRFKRSPAGFDPGA